MALGDHGHTSSGGVSSAGQVALAYQAGKGLRPLAVAGIPPVDSSWPECHPAGKGAFSSTPQTRGAGGGVPETHHHVGSPRETAGKIGSRAISSHASLPGKSKMAFVSWGLLF